MSTGTHPTVVRNTVSRAIVGHPLQSRDGHFSALRRRTIVCWLWCTIRPARPDDAPGVRYVGTVSWPATYGSDKGAAYVMSGLDQFWNAEAIGSAIQAGNIYVAESEQGIVGMVHVEELGADMVMWKLYVLPDHQLHGIGRLLVGAAKSHAGAHGKELVTEYDPSNERVRGFYLREGFEATASLWPGSDARWLRWTVVADQ
ncbi:GNAT family N-acetyltransferase [Microbacterium lacticum]